MDIKYADNRIIIKDVKDLDLCETLLCGQCFRWYKNDDNGFSGVIYKKALRLFQDKDTITVEGAEKEDIPLIRDYFDLDLDYKMIREKLSEIHPVLREAAAYSPGIRILRQEPFEALISFIISQNNNISRIQGIVKRLCENFGERIDDENFAFPEPAMLSSLESDDLSVIRAGFRNRYIIDAARRVYSGDIDLEKIRHMQYDEAQNELMRIKGVGKKVADCTLLYGLHRLDGFPLDVWMKRAMKILFDDMDPKAFGEYGGIAQQYIFHYSRMHKELFEKQEDD